MFGFETKTIDKAFHDRLVRMLNNNVEVPRKLHKNVEVARMLYENVEVARVLYENVEDGL